MIHQAKSTGVPHIHVATSTSALMWQVCAALIPGLLVLIFTQGTRWLGLLFIAILSAWLCEALILKLRRKPDIHKTVLDGSATLTACLLVLSLPVMVPAWLVIFGVAFAIVFGKQLYGGLGSNPFNPAMVGYCFLLISFPALMSQHSDTPLSLSSLWQDMDATTAATLLDQTRQMRIGEEALVSVWPSFSELSVLLAWLIGGLWLAWKRALDWRITAAVLIGILLSGGVFWAMNSSAYLNPLAQLFTGASLFGALFIATDPVTAATTPIGRWVYGVLIGGLCVCIRNLGNFPDGFAFAVLLANACVPILDSLTRPRYV